MNVAVVWYNMGNAYNNRNILVNNGITPQHYETLNYDQSKIH